jgi:hypothetical protein
MKNRMEYSLTDEKLNNFEAMHNFSDLENQESIAPIFSISKFQRRKCFLSLLMINLSNIQEIKDHILESKFWRILINC